MVADTPRASGSRSSPARPSKASRQPAPAAWPRACPRPSSPNASRNRDENHAGQAANGRPPWLLGLDVQDSRR
jgi:hypothetical protein